MSHPQSLIQGPSSLPSDYAILSRYSAHVHADNLNSPILESDDDDDESRHDDEDDALLGGSSSKRRFSSPSVRGRPSRLTIASSTRSRRESVLAPRSPPVGENTPLITPEVPRIREDEHEADNGTMALFWEEMKILTKYSLPVFGTHILEYSLLMSSVVSIGHLGTTPLAAITLGTMTANVTAFSIFQGLASALDTMLPSAWTSSQPYLVGLWTQRMIVVMAITLIPILLIWFNAEAILLGLKQDPEVAHLAALYLRWVSIGLPAYAFNLAIRRYFQCQNLFSIPTRIILLISPLNALLNYLLVWGPQPLRLGFIGAPIATAISFNLVSLSSVLIGVLLARRGGEAGRRAWHPISKRSFTSLWILVKLGVAGVGQTASEWWAWELVALAASLLGPTVLATQSILLSSASTTFQAPFALSVAASVRIGNLLGEQNPRRAGLSANTSLVLALFIAAIWSTMFITLRTSWGRLFNDDEEVVALVASILPLVALFQVADGLAGVTGGILRAGGKQGTGALLNLSAYYIIGIPFGIYLAFKQGMGIYGLWIGLTVSLAYCSIFGVVLSVRTDWEYEVGKVRKRLENEGKVRRDEEHAERA